MYDRIAAFVRDSVWLITPEMLKTIAGIVDRRVAGVKLDAESLKTFSASNRKQRDVVTSSAVGVLPIMGPIIHHGNMIDDASGITSVDSLSAGFDTLQGMDEVGTVLLHIDSPGGTYHGIPEFAAKVRAARGGKPIIAHINAEAGSGALWIASAADEVVITPSGDAGSIGAYRMHEETSELDGKLGIKRRYIVDNGSEYKVEGNSTEPLSDEAIAFHQAEVDRVGDEFRSVLARNRGVPIKTVRDDWGRGRMLNAKQAQAVGMVDRIATYEDTVSRFASGRGRVKSKARVENARRWLNIT